MTENVNLALKADRSGLGKIKVAPRVLEIIASIAAVRVKGVSRMRSSLTTGLDKLMGRQGFGQGVKLTFDQQRRLIVDIYVFIDYGYSVPRVALQIQSQVKQQLLFMTELRVGAVNVHVNGIIPRKRVSKVNPDRLFRK